MTSHDHRGNCAGRAAVICARIRWREPPHAVISAADLNARMTGTLATTLGLVVVEAAPERVVGEFTVKTS